MLTAQIVILAHAGIHWAYAKTYVQNKMDTGFRRNVEFRSLDHISLVRTV